MTDYPDLPDWFIEHTEKQSPEEAERWRQKKQDAQLLEGLRRFAASNNLAVESLNTMSHDILMASKEIRNIEWEIYDE